MAWTYSSLWPAVGVQVGLDELAAHQVAAAEVVASELVDASVRELVAV
jgi:hypothetical protein